jgi:hypothetical protein
MKKILLLTLVFLLVHNLAIFAQDKETDEQVGVGNIASYNADGYRDPFMPQIKKEEKKKESDDSSVGREVVIPDFSIQGMVWSSDNPQAIIDGQVLRIGDEIKEAKILSISKEGVKFLFRGKIFTAKPKVTLGVRK